MRWTNYLMAAGGVVGMHVENSDETVSTRYFHKDHLGSIAVITDESGAVVERLSYDAWGKRRNADGSDDPSGSITSQTSRGFTGHEELDSVGLVHMNGRVYDPLLGPLRHRRPDDREPVLHPRLEPLLLRRQLPAQLHRPQRLLLHGLLLEVRISGPSAISSARTGAASSRSPPPRPARRSALSPVCAVARHCDRHRHHQRQLGACLQSWVHQSRHRCGLLRRRELTGSSRGLDQSFRGWAHVGGPCHMAGHALVGSVGRSVGRSAVGPTAEPSSDRVAPASTVS